LDALVSFHSNKQRYPNLRKIVVGESIKEGASRERSLRLGYLYEAGMSLGGQLVQRYSILGESNCSEGVRLSYVVMSPSTYVYLDYDQEYKYGLCGIDQALSHYPPGLVDVLQLWQRLQRRQIHYLLGGKDHGIGDDRPAAMVQGANRLERFEGWKLYISRHGLATRDNFTIVARVGHDAGQM
jgi:hypothetical protein